MTPRELEWLLEAHREQTEMNARREREKIYNLAGAIRTMIWSKHPPDYDQMFPKDRKEMSDEEMYAQVRALNAMFGGKEE